MWQQLHKDSFKTPELGKCSIVLPHFLLTDSMKNYKDLTVENNNKSAKLPVKTQY